jgi:hypothetical protein
MNVHSLSNPNLSLLYVLVKSGVYSLTQNSMLFAGIQMSAGRDPPMVIETTAPQT